VYDVDRNNAPAIAHAGNYVHIVWENTTDNDILYRRYDLTSKTWNSVLKVHNSTHFFPPYNPDVAAGAGGQVFVVWDYLIESDPQPDRYALLYARSDTSGTTFLPSIPSSIFYHREVGTDKPAGEHEDYVRYEPTGNVYLDHLRPSIALNSEGWPAVVWHAGGSVGVYYSYAISGTGLSVTWLTTTLLAGGQLGAPAVGVGKAVGEDQYLHIAYMRNQGGNAWEIYYDSDEMNRYPHVYLPLILNCEGGDT